ncbi:MAG: hypothetical protein V4757_05005 [Pseudomonadota bacterium]
MSDVDLRELVARLCEAELASLGHSPAAVTWGGSQTAADGGLDVRVELHGGFPINGFIPRPSTGFQVKKPDMPRVQILEEIAPQGVVRESIRDLTERSGAYIIVSSSGSTADAPLRNRRRAMRDALHGVDSSERLQTDFYDRTRVATWTRQHPGVIAWMKERIGRRLQGWSPYGNWSGSPEAADAAYLVDEQVKLQSTRSPQKAEGFLEAFERLRDELRSPGKVVRLVGLSGVGKTRLAQALFDRRIGGDALPSSIAIYCNVSDHPDPQPVRLASDLNASQHRAILVIDNCPPDLNSRLTEVSRLPESAISLLTIEYDVRDDQPEGTDVFSLEASSHELIAKLLHRRFPDISVVNVRTIAEASGGNSRIAIAIAETVGSSENISGLSSEDLFVRLFKQRQVEDTRLLRAAQACSLLYSFRGDIFEGLDAELPRLATLAGQSAEEVYAHVAELNRRGLVQERGPWRAVLPHAIANRLAARALGDLPFNLIDTQLLTGGSARLAKSFSRRLSYLPDNVRGQQIVRDWLSVDGWLGNVSRFNELGLAMFENVASVCPQEALAALERAALLAPQTISRHVSLLRSLAYEADDFPRSASLLVTIAAGSDGYRSKQAQDAFVPLFGLYLSGTHASIEQRLSFVSNLLILSDEKKRALGLLALQRTLQTGRFTSSAQFSFGSRPRDFGLHPRNARDVHDWYASALDLVMALDRNQPELRAQLRSTIAQNFHGLWFESDLQEELERLANVFCETTFWREGWAACRKAIRLGHEKQPEDLRRRLAQLELKLRPKDFAEEVDAYVLGMLWGGSGADLIDSEGLDASDISTAYERLTQKARDLGRTYGESAHPVEGVLAAVSRGGARVRAFGEGLAQGSSDVRATWAVLLTEQERVPSSERRSDLLDGFIAGVQLIKPDITHELVDVLMGIPTLRFFVPYLYSGLTIDQDAVDRMIDVLDSGDAQPWRFQHSFHSVEVDALIVRRFSEALATHPGGHKVAVGIVQWRIYLEFQQKRSPDPNLLEAGQDLLRAANIDREAEDDHKNYQLTQLIEACLRSGSGAPIAARLAGQLRNAAFTFRMDQQTILESLLKVQPDATLTTLFDGDEATLDRFLDVFHIFTDRKNPADVMSPQTLLHWCHADAQRRFAIASKFVSFAQSELKEGQPRWTSLAWALLEEAPNPQVVLSNFIERFRPSSWSGSRADIMARNVSLLEHLPANLSREARAFATEKHSLLAADVVRERIGENSAESLQNERFE